MVEAVAPVTRLSVAALTLGWTNWTALACPTSKLVQLMTARSLVCVTVSLPKSGVGSKALWVMEDRDHNNQKMEIADEVVEYDPPRRIKVRFSSAEGFDGDGVFTLTDLGNGRTRVDQVGEYRFHQWMAKLFLPLIMHSAGSKAVEDMQRLKSKVEESRAN